MHSHRKRTHRHRPVTPDEGGQAPARKRIAHVCGYCDKEYKSKGGLTKHVRKVHAEEERNATTPRAHGKKVELDLFSSDTEVEGADDPVPPATSPPAVESRPDTPHSPSSGSSSDSPELEGNDLDVEFMP